MITMEQAIDLFKKNTGSNVGAIFELPDKWVLEEVDEKGNAPDTSPLYVTKKDGKIGVFFPPDHFEEMENAVRIR